MKKPARAAPRPELNYTLAEAAALLRVSPSTLRRLIASGALTAIAVSPRRIVVPVAAVKSYRGYDLRSVPRTNTKLAPTAQDVRAWERAYYDAIRYQPRTRATRATRAARKAK